MAPALPDLIEICVAVGSAFGGFVGWLMRASRGEEMVQNIVTYGALGAIVGAATGLALGAAFALNGGVG